MKEDTKKYIIGSFKSIPLGVGFGIVVGLLFGFAIGCIACGLSTLIISNYILENFMIDKEAKSINS